MRKSILMGVMLVGMLFTLQAHAQTNESIVSFDAVLDIHQDATVLVTEKVVYDFGSDERHGIYRDIPISYPTSLGNTSVKISDISVTDPSGGAYQFTQSTIGRDKEIKIGDPDVLIHGTKTYIISYTVTRALGYFTDFDELYWNITGNDWKVSIAKASAEFILPNQVASSSVHASCYEGHMGPQLHVKQLLLAHQRKLVG